jgi:hypothetical protein
VSIVGQRIEKQVRQWVAGEMSVQRLGKLREHEAACCHAALLGFAAEICSCGFVDVPHPRRAAIGSRPVASPSPQPDMPPIVVRHVGIGQADNFS